MTGGASGIGAALSRAMVARGDTVVIADIDGEGAQTQAKALNEQGTGRAWATDLDVRDADAVGALVQRVAREEGRLDVMVNNAGIAVGGEMHELSLAHWDRVIDINLRGVVHGVHAAFPVMSRQGSGHIVNTASLAGLVPSPLLTPYSATKHAVVGLSLALRPEAAAHGVRVTAVCPGFTDTPILDKAGPADLSKPALAEYGRELASKAQGGLYSPEALAKDILRGMDRNRGLVVAPRSARVAWRAVRLAPGLSNAVGKLEMRYVRRLKA
ncbi:SDR family NAD(P)-dependent oxidoreductase [Nocardioides sp. CF8]|uniref:SDR family NAD(P)-dependent oxidoreductase n=1 Tax=Nocardioides sp. CF8 TaxID=110319 RepID=UPI0018DBA2CA|nr:SDR family oxidoreductase [Nocardioides sp. CF8]